MYYDAFEDRFGSLAREKLIKIYKNGDSSVHFDLKLRQNYNPNEVLKQISQQLGLSSRNNLRFFNVEGLEITPEEFDYIDDGETLHCSQGEDFDQFSSFSEYQIMKLLGEGGFGKVMLGIHKQTKEKVAIKFINVSKFGNAHDIDMIFSEMETLKALNHKHIVGILKCFNLKNSQLAYVMEYLEGGELLNLVRERDRIPEEEVRDYFIQITDAMYYCHREKLIHRDLKLENIMLVNKNSRSIKVVDFGVAGLNTNLSIDNEAGSLNYMPPEILSGQSKSVTPAIDVWAMGCILFGMICGELPFNGDTNKETTDRICSGEFAFPPFLEKSLSREVKDLIQKILVLNPNDRYTISDIQKHPWMLGTKLKVEEKPFKEEIIEPKTDVKVKKPALKDLKITKAWHSDSAKSSSAKVSSANTVTSKKKSSIFFPLGSDNQPGSASKKPSTFLQGSQSPSKKNSVLEEKTDARHMKRASLQMGTMPKK